MAPRATQKAKRSPTKSKSSSAELSTAIERLESKVKSLQEERDRLAAELKAAKATIASLESAQTDAVNRIDWVIDSLHNILEDKA